MLFVFYVVGGDCGGYVGMVVFDFWWFGVDYWCVDVGCVGVGVGWY